MDNENVLVNLRLLVKESSQGQKDLVGYSIGANAKNEIINIIISTNPADTALSTFCASCLTQLLSQENDNLSEKQLELLSIWLQGAFESSKSTTVEKNIISAITTLVIGHPRFVTYFWERIFHPKYSTVICRLESSADASGEELLLVVVKCMDVMLGSFIETQLTEPQVEVSEAIANALLRLHYSVRPPISDSTNLPPFLLNSLSVLNKVVSLYPVYAQQHASELFGLTKAYMHCGIEDNDSERAVPQKIHPSQQILYDSTEEGDVFDTNTQSRSCGRKVKRTRKPRRNAGKGPTRQLELSNQQRFPQGETTEMVNFDFKISDSDASDSELTGNQPANPRNLRAKIRLVSIVLVGSVARSLERRTIFAYWHALLPSAIGSNSRNDLLQVSQRDPNARCRIASLQVTSQLLLNSKVFIGQAEDGTDRRTAAFLPFSQSLGLMISAIFDALTSILAKENSLPVLTQALKCLALLVQATPFHRFNSAFVLDFVHHLQRLVHHRDCTIQVSALMVLEFLLTTPEFTPDIAEALGLPRPNLAMPNNEIRQGDEATDLIEVESFEEYIDSDEVESGNEACTISVQHSTTQKKGDGSPWLLMRVIQNLECDGHRTKVPTSVRIESLQVLSSMASHFTLLKGYLNRIELALEKSLQDSLADVRLYAARCLDSCAYNMGRHLVLENGTARSGEDLDSCMRFWERILPVVLAYIRDTQNELPTLKVCLFDALSNIGVIIFERLPHATQMNLLSFLSGISCDVAEDMTVKAAATRALAVFVLFPSLRDNLVLIENVAELILLLVTDTNLLVRIKSFWSMGNVSDALLSNNDSRERISDGLLRRLIDAAVEACLKDNDKVRCNAVRTLGNLLRLLTDKHLNDIAYRAIFQKAVIRLIDCIRSSGNAKVKWNSCYAIGNFMRNRELFVATSKYADLNWQASLYPALCHIIVHHSNFKVRINATSTITHIGEREYFGEHFEMFWAALLAAIEQSYNLDNFYEYNHRDQLQEELCLAMSHVIQCSLTDDFPLLKKLLTERLDVVRNTWMRVTNRVLPEKAAPLIACSVLLQKRLGDNSQMTAEQRNSIAFIAQIFATF